MKITTILFKIFQTILSFLVFVLSLCGVLSIYTESEHFYDNLFKDKEKIECIVESYRNSTPIDNSLNNYRIDYKDKKLYISTETCNNICEFDNNGKILESSFTLVKKPYIIYFFGYLFFIFIMVFVNDIIYNDTKKENKS